VAVAVGYPAVTGAAPHTVGDPVPPRPRSNVRPVGVRIVDDETGLTTGRIVGYRAVCSCGWRGTKWRSWREASAERRYHAAGHDAEPT
jgi:hypothetical protein